MKFTPASAVLSAVLFVESVRAHTRVFSLHINGVDQGKGENVYLRQPPNNSPVKDLKSPDMRCNVGGNSPVPSFVSVPAGGKVEPEWFHDNRHDDIIDGSHVGPIITYLAPAESNGAGNVWVKIAEEGFDGSKWAVDKIKANKGKHTVVIPPTLAAGDYILRVEIAALHESDTLFTQNAARGIQMYPSCSQITVTGSGAATLPAGVAFPGAYDDATPGILFNVYNQPASSYVIPGPPVWNGVGGTAPPATTVAPPTEPTPEPTTIVEPPTEPTTIVEPPTEPTTIVEPPTEPTTIVEPPTEPTTVVEPPTEPTTVVEPPTEPTTIVAPPPAPTTTVAPPPPTPTGGVKDANVCWRQYNKCLDASQPFPDFPGCSATRDTCLVGAQYIKRAHARMQKRRL